MTSYAYEENNLIDKAKFLVVNSLKQSSNDLWSWHALLHVHDNENNDSINKNDNFNKINYAQFLCSPLFQEGVDLRTYRFRFKTFSLVPPTYLKTNLFW